MSQPMLFGIPNCDTVRKARKWLDEQSQAHEFIDLRADTPSPFNIPVPTPRQSAPESLLVSALLWSAPYRARCEAFASNAYDRWKRRQRPLLAR